MKDVARANFLAGTVDLPAVVDHDTPAFNIATATQMNVLELAQAVGRVVGRKPEITFEPPRAGELMRSSLDTTKAKRILGWQPTHRFDQGLGELVAWFEQEVAA